MVTVFLNRVFFQFTCQLLISTAPVVLYLPGRRNFLLRMLTGLAGLFGIIYILSIPFAATISALSSVLFYLGTAAGVWIFLQFLFNVSRLDALFYTVEGYAIEHMAYAVGSTAEYVSGFNETTMNLLLYTILDRYILYILFAVFIYLLFIRNSSLCQSSGQMDQRILILSVITVFLAIVFSIIYYQRPADIVTRVICPVYGFSACAFILFIGNGILQENRLEQEKREMEHMLELSRNQQEASKEAINIINMKCHDLKHSLRQIERMDSSKARSEYIQEITDAVNIYDADYHTGYDSLDYVLREKALLCHENDIEFSVIADGGIMTFMDSIDLYTLMGNALDNAIEREKKEKEEKRFISVKITENAGMKLLSVENYCSNSPVFRNGLPETSKEDKNFHGFGVRSIRYIVEKYQGEVSMDVKDEVFRLHAIF